MVELMPMLTTLAKLERRANTVPISLVHTGSTWLQHTPKDDFRRESRVSGMFVLLYWRRLPSFVYVAAWLVDECIIYIYWLGVRMAITCILV